MEDIFIIKIEALKTEFPQYWIQWWGPNDFRTYKPNLTDEQCMQITQILYKESDIIAGTDFNDVADIIDKVLA